MRTLLLGGLAAAALAAVPAAPADAACFGTASIGTYCVTVSFGPRHELELEQHDDCVYAGTSDCVPVTYYTPVLHPVTFPTVDQSCTGVFVQLGLNC